MGGEGGGEFLVVAIPTGGEVPKAATLATPPASLAPAPLTPTVIFSSHTDFAPADAYSDAEDGAPTVVDEDSPVVDEPMLCELDVAGHDMLSFAAESLYPLGGCSLAWERSPLMTLAGSTSPMMTAVGTHSPMMTAASHSPLMRTADERPRLPTAGGSSDSVPQWVPIDCGSTSESDFGTIGPWHIMAEIERTPDFVLARGGRVPIEASVAFFVLHSGPFLHGNFGEPCAKVDERALRGRLLVHVHRWHCEDI
mmetsp:Transcript_16422/g.52697  ORF Transcript_16422/g.52697 Transcript_16422/m.52697 type:complete len:253 (-) Transcript_16422:496-1254(-)